MRYNCAYNTNFITVNAAKDVDNPKPWQGSHKVKPDIKLVKCNKNTSIMVESLKLTVKHVTTPDITTGQFKQVRDKDHLQRLLTPLTLRCDYREQRNRSI